jgi:glycine betaine/proline transport system substrate-binding protein
MDRQHITTYVAGEVLKRMGYNVEYTTAGYLPQFEAIQDGTVTAS